MRPDQNELWERYEDAMFTLLMDEVAHQEGQEQLEWKKQLNNDPSAALPEEVRKKGEQTIPRLLIRKHKKVSKINVFKGREHGTKSKNLILTGTKGADVKISALFLSPRHR